MQFKKLLSVALAVALVAGLAFAGGQKDAGATESKGFSGSYSFGGSTTTLPIFEAAIEMFAEKHPNAKITYEAPGSSAGVTGVIDGVYSIGGSSREIKAEEKAKGVLPIAIALDGIAIVVNGGVAVDNLSVEQVGKIFTGEYRNWSQVGGPNKAIVVVNRDEASGTRAAFLELVLDHVFGKGKAKFLLDAVTVESNGDMVTKVGSTPDAIGYCGFGYIDKARNAGGKEIAVEKIAPSVANVLSGTYPVSRKLYAMTKGQAAAGSLEKAFIDFLLSKDGQAIVAKEGFIALP